MSKKSIRFYIDREVMAVWDDLKFEAPDGKQRKADVLRSEDVLLRAKHIPNNKAIDFLNWFTYSDNTNDGQSRKKAYNFIKAIL